MFITAGRPFPTPRHGMRRAPAYLAESIRVLASARRPSAARDERTGKGDGIPPHGDAPGAPFCSDSVIKPLGAACPASDNDLRQANGKRRKAVWATRQRAKGSPGPHVAHLPPHFPLRLPPCRPRQIRNSVRRRKTSKNRDFIGIFLVFLRLARQEITVKMLFITVLQGRTDLFHYLCPVFN